MTRDLGWLVLLTTVVLFGGMTLVAPLSAQEDESADPRIEDDFLESEPRPEIDEFLAGDMEVLAGGGTTYEAGERRDPFVSLLKDAPPPCDPSSGKNCQDKRPEGVPGLLIDSVEVTGIFVTAQGPVAQVRVPREKKGYLLREGDQLWDGDVTSIAFDEVVFRQNSPAEIKPFRPVVKKLKPQGGKGS